MKPDPDSYGLWHPSNKFGVVWIHQQSHQNRFAKCRPIPQAKTASILQSSFASGSNPTVTQRWNCSGAAKRNPVVNVCRGGMSQYLNLTATSALA